MKLSSAYEPAEYEAKMYALWEQGRVFLADPKSSKPHFSISMPPPNETGSLHAGHAIFLALQDVLARRARQEGKDVLWLPGTDHAALAVNALVEKQLAEQGTDKHAIGRQEFLHKTREFVAANRGTMNKQIRAIGAGVDWSRARYTLDDALNRCVNEVFVRMYDDGLIYRGDRIVNWDPKLQTTVSDDEVVYHEEKTPFYTLQFGPFQIGTARPETKFGDKYVVMHPDDERYAQYKDGDTFELEWINGPITATVVKDEAVDPQFGTGVMTITPWHDHTDFEIAERHGLEKTQVIDFDGKLLPLAGEFSGQGIAEARPKIVDKMQAKGLIVRVDENYTHNIAQNDRGKGVIEPQIKLQWFIDVNRQVIDWKGQLRSLKEVMRAVIDDGDIEIIPKRFERLYFHWIDNLRDWNISRQIWWGHRIPVWYKAEERYAGVQPPKGEGWQQDPDTLDTWFSSALWTWSTLIDQELAKDFSLSLEELLNKSQDFKTYHPTSVMETGWDILFFWVARMILATTYTMSATNQPEDKRVPFRQVYLHGLVRTEAGRKMSKSDPEGNIDPQEIIDEFGADALRLTLVASTTAGNDQRLGKSKVAANRNFCNKLWNIARFTEANAGEHVGSPVPKSPADHWILNKLSIFSDEVGQSLTDFRFNDAYQQLYHFVWDDLADWYIEASKVEPSPAVLAYVLKNTLLLAHPFAPFVTEAIWQSLSWEEGLLASMELPRLISADQKSAGDFDEIVSISRVCRAMATATGVKKPTLFVKNKSILASNNNLVIRLARLGRIEEGEPENSQRIIRIGLSSLDIEAWLDIDIQKYTKGLEEQKTMHQTNIERLESRLSNKAYLENAPEDLVAETRQELEEAKIYLEAIEKQLKL